MLSDAERQALRDIQRRLAADDPDFVRRFRSAGRGRTVARRRNAARRRVARLGAISLAEVVIALAVVGPNVLTEARIAALRQPPAPRRSTR
ncbi:DUF3040 domain-containing protein [Saccharothrix hoggarensis]|uniref:DUF3040 domain-containing protein n=1 Tax=Saccharothrix hoggarensis TaxID=913853 RepID=A0ABW3R374_9PSEU